MKILVIIGWSVVISAIMFVNLHASNARHPAVAGAFYPADKTTLSRMIDSLISLAAVPKVENPESRGDIGRPVALISPHAGYIYSGATAAHGYKLLQGLRYSTVVIVGPSHRAPFNGCAVYDRGKWATPLGEVDIDSNLASKIVAIGGSIFAGTCEHAAEHSLEVQLPFLQRVLTDFKVVPIEMGYQSEANIHALAEALADVLEGRDDVLLVASTDLSHFHPRTQAQKLDSYCIGFIERLDGAGLASKVQTDEAEMCGGGPTAAVLLACKKLCAQGVQILKYDDSGTTSGDVSGVVGYVSAVIFKEESVQEHGAKKVTAEYLDKAQQQTLLTIARESIEAAVNGQSVPSQPAPGGKLSEPGAAFVTITIGGQLRGCIGYTEAFMPLYQCVSECAVSAAMHDPRFSPLSKAEYPLVELEISVLTPLVDVSDINDIVVGRDGLMISKSGRRGLLLPQVATDYGWDRETFLRQTCHKAGLPADAWQSGAKIQKFTAFVFHEE
jgi:AmmeMemoRadiSam system protein B/AmmeMemoRadiSam system protein A